MVTTWRDTVRDLLAAAAIPESELAESVGMHKVVLNRYLRGKRSPRAEVIRKIDRHAERLIGKGVAVLLDLAALYEGLIDVDDAALVDGALQALEGLERRGMLVDDWRARFCKRVEAMADDDKALRALIAAVFYADRKPLMDDLKGVTPISSSLEYVRRELSKRGLGDLFAKRAHHRDSVDAFLSIVRDVLLTPPTNATERLEAEERLMRAAWNFAGSIGGAGGLQRLLSGGNQ